MCEVVGKEAKSPIPCSPSYTKTHGAHATEALPAKPGIVLQTTFSLRIPMYDTEGPKVSQVKKPRLFLRGVSRPRSPWLIALPKCP